MEISRLKTRTFAIVFAKYSLAAASDTDTSTVGKFKLLGLLEPWIRDNTHEFERHKRTQFLLVIETRTVVDVQFLDQTFRGLPHRPVKARKNVHSFWLSLTMRESLETSDLKTEHRPPFLSLSLMKTVSSCVVQIVCVITNQGSSNPNCLNFLKDAYKVYQGVPPTYYRG